MNDYLTTTKNIHYKNFDKISEYQKKFFFSKIIKKNFYKKNISEIQNLIFLKHHITIPFFEIKRLIQIEFNNLDLNLFQNVLIPTKMTNFQKEKIFEISEKVSIDIVSKRTGIDKKKYSKLG